MKEKLFLIQTEGSTRDDRRRFCHYKSKRKHLIAPLRSTDRGRRKTFVLVPGSQKEPDKIFIKVGLRNDEFFEILEGLNKDQEVMIPPANIQDSLPNQGPMGMGGPPPAGM